jgi:hypothetical protein
MIAGASSHGNLAKRQWHPPLLPRGAPRFYFAIAFLVGLVQPITIHFVGQIPVSELLLLIVIAHAAIALATTRTLPSSVPSPRILALVLIAQLVAFSSYIVSDLWCQSLPRDMLRGWLRMIFVLVDTAALALLFGAGSRTFLLLQIGTILSCLFTFLEGPLFNDYWKFCFAYPVTVVVLLAAPRLLGCWATVLASLLLGILHLHMRYRILGWVCLLLAALLIGANILPRLGRKYIFLACTSLLLAGMPWAFRTFLTDPAEVDRSNIERSAMMQAAWEGFLASPLIGNGSWFSTSNVWDNFLIIRSQKARESGRGFGFDATSFEGVAIHSQILTALAEGGLFGGTFFFIYTVLILLSFWFLLTDATWHWLMPIRLSILITSLTGVVMDPFSGTARLGIGIGFALSLVLLAERKAFWRRLGEAPDVYSRKLVAGAVLSKPS